MAGGVIVKDEPEAEVEQEDTQAMKKEDVHRGRNKSNRSWKSPRTEKASMAIYRPLKKTLGSTWEKKQADKLKLKEAKELQNEIVEKKREQVQKDLKRLAEKRKRKAENELRSAKVQVMSHPEKIKKMSKKQLRSVYKTRMGEDGVVRLVGAYE